MSQKLQDPRNAAPQLRVLEGGRSLEHGTTQPENEALTPPTSVTLREHSRNQGQGRDTS